MASSPLVLWRVMTRPKPGTQACSPPRARAAPPHHRLVPPRARRVPGDGPVPCLLPLPGGFRTPGPPGRRTCRQRPDRVRRVSEPFPGSLPGAAVQPARSSELCSPRPRGAGRWLSSSTLDASRVPTVCLSHPCSSGPVCVKYVNKLKYLLWAASFVDGLI